MKIRKIIFPFILCFLPILVFSQQNKQVVIKGTVLDAQVNEPISSVSIALTNKDEGTRTNESGQFTLVIKSSDRTANSRIKVSCVGYKTELLSLPAENKEMDIWLISDTHVLSGVTVKKQR